MLSTFQDDLKRFETALAERPLSCDDLVSALRGLDVPADVCGADLTRYIRCSYHLLGIRDDDFSEILLSDVGPQAAWYLAVCAEEMIEHVLYDRVAGNRAWVEERVAWFRERGKEVPDAYLDHGLPPALSIPWDLVTARERLAPLLTLWEARLAHVPTAHFRLCWNVRRNGYQVFQKVIGEWLRRIEARGIGQPDTLAAFEKAEELLKKAESRARISWMECERDVLSLLGEAHPMVVGGAARYLGALYANDGIVDCSDAPSLVAVLDRLSELPCFRAIACGGFVDGFDLDCRGLQTLATDPRAREAGFDIDLWILKIVASDDYEPYLPNAQALWFYIHEFYDLDPAMVMKFIDLKRDWLALMCATEVREKVSGMKTVLERLAASSDADIAGAARWHLNEYYD